MNLHNPGHELQSIINKAQTDQNYVRQSSNFSSTPEQKKKNSFPQFHQSACEQRNPIQPEQPQKKKAKQLTHPTMYGLAEPSTGKFTTPVTAGDPPRSPLLACRALSRSMRCSMRTPLWGNARSSVSAASVGADADAADEAVPERSTATATAIAIATSAGLIGSRRGEARRRKRALLGAVAAAARTRSRIRTPFLALKGLVTDVNLRRSCICPPIVPQP